MNKSLKELSVLSICNFISGKPGKAGTDAIQMQVGFAETCFGNNLFELLKDWYAWKMWALENC